jgi:regulator of protease activity HflC (stomatin/prohibitin superfamily)
MKELTIGSFRAVMGKVNTVTLASERDDVSDRTLANLRSVLSPYGIIADETRLLSIEFSKQFEAKIEQAAEEKAAVERAVQTARLREQEAFALVTKAKGPTAFAWPALPKPSACANGPRRFARIRS